MGYGAVSSRRDHSRRREFCSLCCQRGKADAHCSAQGSASTLPSSLILGKHREIARDFGNTLSDLCTLSGIYIDDFSEVAVSQALHLMHPAPRV